MSGGWAQQGLSRGSGWGWLHEAASVRPVPGPRATCGPRQLRGEGAGLGPRGPAVSDGSYLPADMPASFSGRI